MPRSWRRSIPPSPLPAGDVNHFDHASEFDPADQLAGWQFSDARDLHLVRDVIQSVNDLALAAAALATHRATAG